MYLVLQVFHMNIQLLHNIENINLSINMHISYMFFFIHRLKNNIFFLFFFMTYF